MKAIVEYKELDKRQVALIRFCLTNITKKYANEETMEEAKELAYDLLGVERMYYEDCV